MKRVLMIAFHYPPCSSSSGLQRTLSFSRQLPALGWWPVVLTAHPRAYEQLRDDQLGDIPSQVVVKRAFALDAARHLALDGRYFNWMALPDRWVSWLVGAVPAGLRLIRKHTPQVIWSTYPIATAHLIGLALHRLTGIPWVADFRDPMVEVDPVTGQQWPTDPQIRRARLQVEELTMKHCAGAVFVAPGALRIYAERYSNLPRERFALIANGYEEGSFAEAERLLAERGSPGRRITLLHSGVLYPTPDRHPKAFFEALARLRIESKISSANLQVILRASSYEDGYRKLVQEMGLEDIVALAPAIPYREALAEMLRADGLLLFQGHDSNPAIPAKLYEYFRARRPVFAMVDAEGDTAGALREAKIGKIVPLDCREEIARGLEEFLERIRQGTAPVPSDEAIRRHSRESKAAELADALDAVTH